MKRIVRLLCGLCIGMLLLSSSRTAEAAQQIEMEHSQLVVDSYEFVDGKLVKGADCTLRIHISNIDDNSAVVSGGIAISSTTVFPSAGKTNQAIFGRVEPGESFYIDFAVCLKEVVTTDPNVIEINLNWVDENNGFYTNYAYISPIAEVASGEPSVLVVDSYEFVNGKFEKSAECTIRVHIRNLSDSNSVKGGCVGFYSSSIYAVTGKTNQVVLNEVKPGEATYVDFDVNLDRIVSGPNLMELNLQWTDETGVGYTNSVNISPVLLETVRFDIKAVNAPETVYGKKTTTLSVSYENSGAENLYNVRMLLGGDIAQGTQIVELGDLYAKGQSLTDCFVELLNMGSNKVAISFTYEDRNGTEYSTEAEEVYVTVTDKAYIAPAEQEMDIVAILVKYRVFVIAAAVAIILWIPLFVSLITKRGKKRGKK